jgi:hypothetical protein
VVFVVNQVCYVAVLDEFGELVSVALAEDALELVDELGGTMAIELIDGEAIEVLDEGGEAMLVPLTCPGGEESGGEEEGGDSP